MTGTHASSTQRSNRSPSATLAARKGRGISRERGSALRWCVGAAAAAVVALFGSSAAAETTAYEVAAPTTGNQAYGGSLGMDFDVNRPILVYALGVFDSNQDGLSVPIVARIFNRTTQQVLVTLTFPAGNTGTLVNGSRFLSLPCPLQLPAGFQGVIEADGYGATEQNGNVNGPARSTDGGGGAISFVGGGRYTATAGAFPTTIDGGPANRYAAGTFVFAEPCAGDGQCTNPDRPKCGVGGTCGSSVGAFFAGCGAGADACDVATATCTTCDADFGPAATGRACPGSSLPACVAGSCMFCSGSHACPGATSPVCKANTSCVACTADNGEAGDACPTTQDPHCKNDGSCGKCASDADCAGRAGGPFCSASGACSADCANDAQCGGSTSGKICSNKTCIDGCAVAAANGPARNGCPAGLICTAKTPGAQGTCGTACASDAECLAVRSGKPRCNAAQACVECVGTSDCSAKPGTTCDTTSYTCNAAQDAGGVDGDAGSSGNDAGSSGNDAGSSGNDAGSDSGASSSSSGSSTSSSGGAASSSSSSSSGSAGASGSSGTTSSSGTTGSPDETSAETPSDDGGCQTTGSSSPTMTPMLVAAAIAVGFARRRKRR